MRVKVRCCSLTKPAADGSIIPESVVRKYLASEDYRLSVEGHLTMGYLTHRGRSVDLVSPDLGGSALKKVIGKDDSGLIVSPNCPAFTHYVEEFFIESDPIDGDLWLMAWVKIFDEDGFDDVAVQNIKRLKALIREGVALTCSLIVVAYWDGNSNGIDRATAIKSIKSLDWTVNPSFGNKARIVEVEDDKVGEEKKFSNVDEDYQFLKSQPKEGEIKVKTFSSPNEIGLEFNYPKSSKIDGQFTILKIKEFSSVSKLEEIDEEIPGIKSKSFSVSSVKERLREGKLSPRMRFRKTYISYKQVVKQMGGPEKIDEETMKILKSLFTSDILDIMKTITPDVLAGKQINVLIGASSLGKSVRQAAQTLQMPFRQAMMESQKLGYVNKNRYQKIQEAYQNFINSLIDDVFVGNSPLPEGIEAEGEENNE